MENLEIIAFDDLDFEVTDICSVDSFTDISGDDIPGTTKTVTSTIFI